MYYWSSGGFFYWPSGGFYYWPSGGFYYWPFPGGMPPAATPPDAGSIMVFVSGDPLVRVIASGEGLIVRVT